MVSLSEAVGIANKANCLRLKTGAFGQDKRKVLVKQPGDSLAEVICSTKEVMLYLLFNYELKIKLVSVKAQKLY